MLVTFCNFLYNTCATDGIFNNNFYLIFYNLKIYIKFNQILFYFDYKKQYKFYQIIF